MNEPLASSEAVSLRVQDRRSTLVVHAAFWSVLLADIALKYLLYFGPLAAGPGFTARHVGATVSHFLIWLFAYVMCLNSSRRPLMGLVAAPTLFLGILVVPLLGWAGILAMYLLRRNEPRQSAPSGSPPEPASGAAPVSAGLSYVDLSLTISTEQTFPADEGGCLAIGPGLLQCRFRMTFRPERARTDEIDVVICSTLVADDEGRVWECRTYLLPDLFTAPVEAGAPAPPSGLIPWSEAPAAWQQAYREHSLIQGIRNLLDSRDCYILPVGGTTYRFRQKYQSPAMDVACIPGPDSSLMVRISGLYHEICLWGEQTSVEELPPFAYAMPWADLVPVTAPRWHYRQWEEWWHIEDEQQKQPLTFQKTDGRTAPQAHVRFCSDPTAHREPQMGQDHER